MNATNILITLSAAQVLAVLFFGLQVGRGLGERDALLKSHGERLDAVEPKVEQLSNDFNFMRGVQKARAAHGG
jgi:hypothetical protein